MLGTIERQTELTELLSFWSRSSADWFSHNSHFDDTFRVRYLDLYGRARAGELRHWEESPEGGLGLLILLDQFPRNAFRGTARMYESDDLAVAAARRAVQAEFIPRVTADMRLFLILPFAHSEAIADQDMSVALHNRFMDRAACRRARRHRRIIRRFGRFPHRNRILGRKSRTAEQLYLATGGFSG